MTTRRRLLAVTDRPRRRTHRLPHIAVVALVLASACSGSEQATTGTAAAPTTTVPAPTTAAPTTTSVPRLATCDGLADRWVEIQQGFLDDLGDAPVPDGAASPEVIEAGRRMGLLLLEHGRDIERAGCDVELAPGSPPLCARLDQLTATGAAGREVIEGLGADCS